MKKFFNEIEAVICSVLLFLMLIILTAQVVSRYVFDSSLGWSEETARYLFIWFIFIGMSYAASKYAHIKIDALLNIFPRKSRKYIETLGTAVWIIFNVIVVIESVKYTAVLFEAGQVSLGTRIPMGVVYLAIPVGFALTTVRLIQNLFSRKSKEEAEYGGVI